MKLILNYLGGDSILRGFMVFVVEPRLFVILVYMEYPQKESRDARSTIAIRDVEVHAKGNLERSARNASYFYINRIFLSFLFLSVSLLRCSRNFADSKVESGFKFSFREDTRRPFVIETYDNLRNKIYVCSDTTIHGPLKT